MNKNIFLVICANGVAETVKHRIMHKIIYLEFRIQYLGFLLHVYYYIFCLFFVLVFWFFFCSVFWLMKLAYNSQNSEKNGPQTSRENTFCDSFLNNYNKF